MRRAWGRLRGTFGAWMRTVLVLVEMRPALSVGPMGTAHRLARVSTITVRELSIAHGGYHSDNL
jgi:hypothetical protein